MRHVVVRGLLGRGTSEKLSGTVVVIEEQAIEVVGEGSLPTLRTVNDNDTAYINTV